MLRFGRRSCFSWQSAERRQVSGSIVWSMDRFEFTARDREAGVRFFRLSSFANFECRRAQLPRTLGRGWEHSNPWFLPCSCRLGLSGRLSRTLDGGRECSTPLSRRRLGKDTAWAADCRERSAEAENVLPPCLVGDSERNCRSSRLSTEAENALPLGLAEGSLCSRKRSRLGIADLADRDAGRRAKWRLLKKIPFL